MAVSPKVSAATVGAAFSTIIAGILGPHLFPHATASDVQGLVEAVVTSVVTFGSGWLARDLPKVEADARTDVAHVAAKVEPVVNVVSTRVQEVAPTVNAVAEALKADVAAQRVTLPVAQAVAVPKV